MGPAGRNRDTVQVPLTVDDVLPLHRTLVLLLAEPVLHGEAPRLGVVVRGVGRQVAEDARVHAVCWWGEGQQIQTLSTGFLKSASV